MSFIRAASSLSKELSSNVNQMSNDELESFLTNILAEYQKSYDGNILSLRNAIPREETWRFLIDGEHQDMGWEERYEKKEPGYLFAMETAFKKVLTQPDNINSVADLDRFIKDLHLIATTDVSNLIYDRPSPIQEEKGLYRQHAFSYVPLNIGNTTEAGIEELLYEIKNYPESTVFPIIFFTKRHTERLTESEIHFQGFFGSAHPGATEKVLKFENFYLIPDSIDHLNAYDFFKKSIPEENYPLKVDLSSIALIKEVISNKTAATMYFVNDGKGDGCNIREMLNEKMHMHIESFCTAIKQIKSAKDMLKTIIVFVRNCERTHPFMDRNTCVFSMALLNYLLIKYGFPPVIRDNPNHSYAHTLEELMQDLLVGMQRTLNLAQGIVPYRVSTKEHYHKLNDIRKLYFQKSVNSRDDQGNFLFPVNHINLTEDQTFLDSLLTAGLTFVKLVKAAPDELTSMIKNSGDDLIATLKLFMNAEKNKSYTTLRILFKDDPVITKTLADIIACKEQRGKSDQYYSLLYYDLLTLESLKWLSEYPNDINKYDNLKGKFIEALITLKIGKLLSEGQALIRDHFTHVTKIVLAIDILNYDKLLNKNNLKLIAANPVMADSIALEIRAKESLIAAGINGARFDALNVEIKAIVSDSYYNIRHLLAYNYDRSDIFTKLVALTDKNIIKIICVNSWYVTDLFSYGVLFDEISSLKIEMLKVIFSKCYVITDLIKINIPFADIVALDIPLVTKILEHNKNLMQLLNEKKLAFNDISKLKETQLETLLSSPDSCEANEILEKLHTANSRVVCRR